MNALVHAALSNALLVCVGALLAAVLSLAWRNPAWRHSLWLLVLLKLVMPPLAELPIGWPTAAASKPAMTVEAAPRPSTRATTIPAVGPPAVASSAVTGTDPPSQGSGGPPNARVASRAEVAATEFVDSNTRTAGG